MWNKKKKKKEEKIDKTDTTITFISPSQRQTKHTETITTNSLECTQKGKT